MIIVTGAGGFIGSNVVADLNEQGCTDIVLVDRLGGDGKWRNIAKRQFSEFVFPQELDGFLANRPRATAVFHLGAISSTTATDADEVIEANFRTSARLWKWCARMSTPFIYASSAATYGNGEGGFDDDESRLSSLSPLNLYGWSKHVFDRWAIEQARRGEAPPHWAGLKFFNVYGPNEYHKGDMQSLVAKNAGRIAADQPVRLFKSYREGYADGEQLRDFVHVADCTRAMLWLAEGKCGPGLFNLGTGRARSFRDLIEATAKALGKAVAIEYQEMPEALRANYQYFTQAPMEKLRRAGFAASFRSLEEGVADYVTQFLAGHDRYR